MKLFSKFITEISEKDIVTSAERSEAEKLFHENVGSKASSHVEFVLLALVRIAPHHIWMALDHSYQKLWAVNLVSREVSIVNEGNFSQNERDAYLEFCSDAAAAGIVLNIKRELSI